MSQKKTTNQKSLTDRLLEHARDSHTPLSLYLVSGFSSRVRSLSTTPNQSLINHKNVHQVVMRDVHIDHVHSCRLPGRNADRWWRPDTDGDAAAS